MNYVKDILMILTLIIIILLTLFIFNFCKTKNVKEGIFGIADENNALSALEDLNNGIIEEVDRDYLKNHAHNIYMAKLRDVGIAANDAEKEHMTFLNPVDTRYWPNYLNSLPYQYQDGGAWPPNMQSRLYNWQPGFETSGWSYWLRPGVYYDKWPRSRWVKQNGNYYFINNGGIKDRKRDYTSDPS